MEHTVPLPEGRLTGKRIGILMENDFVAEEITYYRRRFLEEEADVVLYTRLWGQRSLTFTGHDHSAQVTVDGDLQALGYDELARLAALVVPSGMVSDRLRYSENIGQAAPAVELMRRAFRLPNVVKAFSCHGLMLMSAARDLIGERSVACHNNLIGDVRNMGAVYLDRDIVVDEDLVTSRTVEHCHLLARTVIELVDSRVQKPAT
jgi:protease I